MSVIFTWFKALIDKLACEETIEYFGNKGDDENLQSRLKVALFSINAVANDAEQKQINSPEVREWLLGVKDGVLDAQDLMEEIIHIQVSKSKQGTNQQLD